MNEIFKILVDYLPIGFSFLLIAFIYLIYLYKKQFDRIQSDNKEAIQLVEIRNKQTWEATDKLITMQKESMELQRQKIEILTSELEQYKRANSKIAISELEVIQKSIDNLYALQKEARKENVTDRKWDFSLIENREYFNTHIFFAIQSRNNSQYSVKVNNIIGSSKIMEELRTKDYLPTYYLNLRTSSDVDEEKYKYDGIGFGSEVDYQTIQEVVSISLKYKSDIQYIYYINIKGYEKSIFIAANTTIMGDNFRIKPFTKMDFVKLFSISSNLEMKDFLNSKV